MSFTERIEQRGDSSVPQCSPIVRCQMVFLCLCLVAIGCLDADQGSVVVKPRRAKGPAVSSSESSSPRKTKSSRKADSDRDEKVLDHPELQAELAQVDDLIRTVGGDDAQKPSRKKIRSADEDSVVSAFAEEVVTPTNQAAKELARTGSPKNRVRTCCCMPRTPSIGSRGDQRR